MREHDINLYEYTCMNTYEQTYKPFYNGLYVPRVDVINFAKFHRNRLRCLDFVRGGTMTIRYRLRHHYNTGFELLQLLISTDITVL